MVDWNRIADRLERNGLSHNQAWDALSRAWITYNERKFDGIDDAQVAEFIFKTAIGWHLTWLTRPTQIEKAVQHKHATLTNKQRDNDNFTEDELFEDKPTPQSETDYMVEVLSIVPQAFKIPTLIVVSDLLNKPFGTPVSVEKCRKILQKAGIKNTVYFARQVYTFLTTLRRD